MRVSPREAVLTLLGAVVAPVAVTGYQVAVGYRLPDLAAAGRFPLPLVLALAALGAGVALAVGRGLRVAPALAALALAVLPHSPLFAGPPPANLGAFTADALFTTAGFAIASVVEFGLRAPEAVRRELTPETTRAALAGGAVAVFGVAGLYLVLGLRWVTADLAFTLVASLWMLGGTFLVGAIVAVAAVRFSLVTPALVVLGVGAVGAYDAWQFASSNAAGVGPTLLSLALVGWFVPLAAALLVGAVERVVRAGRGETAT